MMTKSDFQLIDLVPIEEQMELARDTSLGEDCNEFLLDTFQTGTEGPYSVSDLHIARFCNSIICLLFRNVFSSHYL